MAGACSDGLEAEAALAAAMVGARGVERRAASTAPADSVVCAGLQANLCIAVEQAERVGSTGDRNAAGRRTRRRGAVAIGADRNALVGIGELDV